MTPVISVVGLGKLGLPIAACWAKNGYEVIGIDSNPEWVASLSMAPLPLSEPGLDELMSSIGDRITVTTDTALGVTDADITFVIVPTPSRQNGEFSLRNVVSACRDIGVALRSKNEYHLVVIISTVMPGSTGNVIWDILETSSGKQCGKDFGLCYNPVFVALGSVIHDFMHPDMVLIGESDALAGRVLGSLYIVSHQILPSRIARMSLINAELTKLAVNSFVTTKITFANYLAHLCERLPGGNVDVVTSAMGMDGRIGQKYLKGGLGYGGPCFPRDNVAMAALGRQLGDPNLLVGAVHEANQQEARRVADLVQAHRRHGDTVGILGLAYKPHTDVTDQAQGLLLARELSADGVPIVVYDPVVGTESDPFLVEGNVAASLVDCIKGSDVLVIATPWPEFKVLNDMSADELPAVIIDCWRLLNRRYDGIEYIALGRGQTA